MKKLFKILFMAAVVSLMGCGDSLYDVYDDIAGPVQSVVVPSTLSVVVGETAQLHATVYPSMTPNKKVTWTTSNSVVSVDPDTGVVSGNTVNQTAIVTATTEYGEFTADCLVTVVPVPKAIDTLSFTLSTRTIAVLGTEDLKPILVINPNDATSTEMTWHSDNPIYASVDSNGVVTGHSNGSANITATSVHWGKSATITVIVSSAPSTYVVTYDANGGVGVAPVDTTEYISGNNVVVKDPAVSPASLSKPGYSFVHWNTKSDDTGNDVNPGASYPITITNITFYAQWYQLSTNSDLSIILLDGGTITLNPSFSASTTSYNAYVANGVSSVTVTVFKADPNATAVISPVQPSSLVVGLNTITITVTAESGAVKTYTLTIDRAGDYPPTANTGIMEYVSSGTFQRNATGTNKSTVSAFRMSAREVTRTQFLAIMGIDPSNTTYSSGTTDPVQRVTWYDAVEFCNKLSLLESRDPVYTITGRTPASGYPITSATVTANWSATGYRLPTEMEWMWAAMAGMSSGRSSDYTGDINTGGYTKGYAGSTETGSNSTNIGNYAWFITNSGTKTHPTGGKTFNELGIYDMTGNVHEWCWDYNAAYPSGELIDYHGPDLGTVRIYRGGGFNTTLGYYDLSDRSNASPGITTLYNTGFRVVRR
jgi:uncharacterized repeat protein (TIGR02543 family)